MPCAEAQHALCEPISVKHCAYGCKKSVRETLWHYCTGGLPGADGGRERLRTRTTSHPSHGPPRSSLAFTAQGSCAEQLMHHAIRCSPTLTLRPAHGSECALAVLANAVARSSLSQTSREAEFTSAYTCTHVLWRLNRKPEGTCRPEGSPGPGLGRRCEEGARWHARGLCQRSVTAAT